MHIRVWSDNRILGGESQVLLSSRTNNSTLAKSRVLGVIIRDSDHKKSDKTRCRRQGEPRICSQNVSNLISDKTTWKLGGLLEILLNFK